MTANEDLLDEAITLAIVLDRLSRHSYEQAEVRLMELRDDLAVLVVRLDPTSLRYEANRRHRLELLIQRISARISSAYRQIATTLEQDLMDAAEMSQDSLSAVIASLMLIKGLSKRLDQDALMAAITETRISGASIRDWLARQSGDLQFRARAALEDAMRLSLVGREPGAADLVKAVRGTGPGSLFSTAPRHAASLIRSAHHAVASMVRYQTILRHPELFQAIQHLSIIDGKTSLMCKARAGRRWTLQGEPLGHRLPFQRPPLHYACRSHIVPVMHAWDDLTPRMKRRVRPDDFTGEPAQEPGLQEWMELRGGIDLTAPLTASQARKQLGLPA